MNDLCKRLQNLSEAGVYRLNCSLQDLRKSVADCRFDLFEANLAEAHGKGEVLAELARAIAAPDWFGHNWDALADALGDLSWKKSPGYVLLLHGEATGEEMLSDILEATVAFWKLQDKPFWVFFA
jgi:Barstar (barnase inhibitor)